MDETTCTCTACGGPAAYLGGLGRVAWFRCIDCGTEIPRDADDREDEAA